MKAAGLDFLAASSPAAAILLRELAPASGGTISSRKAGYAGVCEVSSDAGPMVPAPRTATLWMDFIEIQDLLKNTGHEAMQTIIAKRNDV